MQRGPGAGRHQPMRVLPEVGQHHHRGVAPGPPVTEPPGWVVPPVW